MSADDRWLFEAWLAGDAEAGRTLVGRHYKSLFLFFHARLDADAAADLTQSTFETLCGKRLDFRGDSSLRTFLFGIARFKLVAHVRRPEAQRVELEAFDDSFVPEASPHSLTSLLSARTRESLLVQALRSLPFDDQVMLELKNYEGMTAREMAEVFGVPAGTVATRLRKARERLRDAVERLAADPQQAERTLTDLDAYMQDIRGRMTQLLAEREAANQPR